MNQFFGYEVPLDPRAAIPLFVLVQALLVYAIDTVFKRFLKAWADSTETIWDDVLVFLTRGMLLTGMVLSIPYVTVQAFVPEGDARHWADNVLYGVIVGGVALVVLRTLAMAGRLLREKSPRASTWAGPVRGLVSLAVIACAFMIVRDYVNAHIETTVFFGYEFRLSPWLLVPLFIAAQGALIAVIQHLFERYLKAWAASTESTWDDLMVWAIQRVVLTLLLLSIPFVVLNSYALLAGLPRHYGNRAITIAAIVSLTWVAYRVLADLLRRWFEKKEGGESIAQPVQTVVKVVFGVIGIMVVLDTLEISITPIITTLGVGSVAIALALQDTLSNLFAGFYVMADRPIRPGDFVMIEGGVEGFVEKIGWRTTRLRTLADNAVIIPNGKLSQATITNFNLPAKPLMVKSKIGVSYDDDPVKVMAVLQEILDGLVREFDACLPQPRPSVNFLPGFGESSLDFTVFLAVRDYRSQFAVLGELNRRVFERFAKEGISIPYPHRTVYLREEKDWKAK